MKRKDNNSGFFLLWRGAIMQLKITTDYAKKTEDISLFDIISSTEVTMKLNRCLEEDGFCSRNATEHCKVHKILLDVQQTYDNLLKGIKVSEIIKPDADGLSE